MLRKKIAAFIAIPTLAFSLAACGGGDSDAKPSKEDVNKGLTKILSSQAFIGKASPTTIKKLASCAVDQMYDKMSNENLNAIADGKKKAEIRKGKEEQFQQDREALSTAAKECTAKYSKELTQTK